MRWLTKITLLAAFVGLPFASGCAFEEDRGYRDHDRHWDHDRDGDRHIDREIRHDEIRQDEIRRDDVRRDHY